MSATGTVGAFLVITGLVGLMPMAIGKGTLRRVARNRSSVARPAYERGGSGIHADKRTKRQRTRRAVAQREINTQLERGSKMRMGRLDETDIWDMGRNGHSGPGAGVILKRVFRFISNLSKTLTGRAARGEGGWPSASSQGSKSPKTLVGRWTA